MRGLILDPNGDYTLQEFDKTEGSRKMQLSTFLGDYSFVPMNGYEFYYSVQGVSESNQVVAAMLQCTFLGRCVILKKDGNTYVDACSEEGSFGELVMQFFENEELENVHQSIIDVDKQLIETFSGDHHTPRGQGIQTNVPDAPKKPQRTKNFELKACDAVRKLF